MLEEKLAKWMISAISKFQRIGALVSNICYSTLGTASAVILQVAHSRSDRNEKNSASYSFCVLGLFEAYRTLVLGPDSGITGAKTSFKERWCLWRRWLLMHQREGLIVEICCWDLFLCRSFLYIQWASLRISTTMHCCMKSTFISYSRIILISGVGTFTAYISTRIRHLTGHLSASKQRCQRLSFVMPGWAVYVSYTWQKQGSQVLHSLSDLYKSDLEATQNEVVCEDSNVGDCRNVLGVGGGATGEDNSQRLDWVERMGSSSALLGHIVHRWRQIVQRDISSKTKNSSKEMKIDVQGL